jgi:hypothetical protein
VNLEQKLKFVLSAVSDDKTRPNLSKPYFDVERKALVATDGKRLHAVELSEGYSEALGMQGFKSCYIDILITKNDFVVKKSSLDLEFPPWRRVVPSYGFASIYDEDNNLRPKCFKLKLDTALEKRYEPSILMAKLGIAIDLDFFKPLSGFTWNVTTDDPQRAAVFLLDESEDLSTFAVIMPLSLKIE